jgi:hypothetical protein
MGNLDKLPRSAKDSVRPLTLPILDIERAVHVFDTSEALHDK